MFKQTVLYIYIYIYSILCMFVAYQLQVGCTSLYSDIIQCCLSSLFLVLFLHIASFMSLSYIYCLFVFLQLQKSMARIQCENGEIISPLMFKDCRIEIVNIVELICSLFPSSEDKVVHGMLQFNLYLSFLKKKFFYLSIHFSPVALQTRIFYF